MRLIGAGLCLILVMGCQGNSHTSAKAVPNEKQVVGKWKYDLKSFKVELDPNLQAKGELESGKDGFKKEVDMLMVDLKNMVGPLVMNFEANHEFSVIAPGTSKPVRGRWSLKGSTLIIAMDRPGQSTPKMSLSADGKRIRTEFDRFGWGKSFADLVKAEENQS